jgi:DNA mismatch repair ATPase MutL
MSALSNRISFALSDEELQTVRSAIKALQDTLVPKLVALGPDDRKELPKMGDRSAQFVVKTFDYVEKNPTLRPAYLDLEEFAADLAAVEVLQSLRRPLAQIAGMVEDSVILSGSEAYIAALACYQAIKGAAKLKMAGAEAIADDLGQQFAGRGRKSPAGPVAAEEVGR